MQRVSFKIAKWLMIIVSLLELALSQIHIKAITAMFHVTLGFYLFLFILFGLLLMFLLTSLKDISINSMFKIALTGFISSGSAAYCIYLMLGDYKSHNNIALSDFRLSLILLISAIGVYSLGILILIGNGLIEHKGAVNIEKKVSN